MWKLVSVHDENVVYHLVAGKLYTVGRKDSSILLGDDNSVSRKHASITIIVSENNFDNFHLLVDDTSKFGTFYVRKEFFEGKRSALLHFNKINKNVSLYNGDVLRIGVQKHIFRVIYMNSALVTCSFDPNTLDVLQQHARRLGIEMTRNWTEDVKYLVSKKIVLNRKVSCALATASSIVSPDYFQKMVDSWEKDPSDSAPDPNDFTPPVLEKNIDCNSSMYSANFSRKKLFKDKTFVFFSTEQLEKYDAICKFAGGSTLSVDDGRFHEDMACAPGTVVVQCKNTSKMLPISESQFGAVQNSLLTNSLRYIQEIEIPIALLYCCIDIYCNPKSDDGYLLSSQTFDSASSSLQSNLSPSNGNTSNAKSNMKVKCTPYAPQFSNDSSDLNHSTASGLLNNVPETIRPSGIENPKSSIPDEEHSSSRNKTVENIVSGLLDDDSEIVKPRRAPKRKKVSKENEDETNKVDLLGSDKPLQEVGHEPVKEAITKTYEMISDGSSLHINEEKPEPKRGKYEIKDMISNLSIANDGNDETNIINPAQQVAENDSIDDIEIPETNEKMKSESQASYLFDDSLWSTKSVKRNYSSSEEDVFSNTDSKPIVKKQCFNNADQSDKVSPNNKPNESVNGAAKLVLDSKPSQSQSHASYTSDSIKIENSYEKSVPERNALQVPRINKASPIIKQEMMETKELPKPLAKYTDGLEMEKDSLSNVVCVDLCVSTPKKKIINDSSINGYANGTSKNVKKFNKVWPVYMSQSVNLSSDSASLNRNSNPVDKIPEIIGGDDLFQFQSQACDDTFGGYITSHFNRKGGKKKQLEFSSSDDSDSDDDNPFSSQNRKKK